MRVVIRGQRSQRGVPAVALADDDQVQSDITRAEGELRAAPALVLDAVEATWTQAVNGAKPNTDQARMLFLSARTAMLAARRAADTVYQWSGGSVVYRDHPIQRCLRAISTPVDNTWPSERPDCAVSPNNSLAFPCNADSDSHYCRP